MIYSATYVTPKSASIKLQFVTCVDILSLGFWWGNWREGDHWGDLGVDGWIILG